MLNGTRLVIVGASLAVIGGSASASDLSWGKPDVSFTQYRSDALTCAAQTEGVTLRINPKTTQGQAALKSANLFTIQTDAGQVGSGNLIQDVFLTQNQTGGRGEVTNVGRDQELHADQVDVRGQLQAILDQCLASKDYVRFRLTDTQRRELDRLRPGSLDRAHFLYGLAANPRVTLEQPANSSPHPG